jgi:hypothetical protein
VAICTKLHAGAASWSLSLIVHETGRRNFK